jgi:8-oxo-dGTP pyrophosphatase MutT (NUDIX family)
MQLSTAPNSAIPAGLRKKPAFDADFKPTGHAAGILFVAPNGDVLLLKRAGEEGKDNFVGHWALPGGGVNADEMPAQGAGREAKEEIGIDINPASMRELDKSATPNGFAFHTYAVRAPDKFRPTLNDEHEGYGWFPLSALPAPMHPAVAKTLADRLGADPVQARDGLNAWLASDEIVEDPGDAGVTNDALASDSVMQIAMDRDSVREKTRDGRLIVKRTPITKANICPYLGKEIPGWEELGLDPSRVYNLLRDPEELEKAAKTSNGVQLLQKHVPVSATEEKSHQPMDTVGSLGTDAEWDGEYLWNSLFVNAKNSIDGIETNRQRELSAGYHYKPDMTPGNFRGSAYDGVMRDIVFNHVALVEDGRAGPDVVVGDEALKESDMAKATRFGAMTLSITAAMIAPLLAMDSKVTLPKDLFAPLTTKNFKDGREKLLSGVRTAIDGKLRSGIALDASMEQLAKAVDAFTDDLEAGIDETAPEDKQAKLDEVAAIEPAKAIAEEGSTYDAEPFKNFLREKGMGEDDIMKACDMMPKPLAGDSDETDEEKKAREEKEAAEKTAKDAEMKDMVSKPAMDAAIAAAVTTVRATERGIRTALAEVKPYVGELPATMAFDSGADVYRHALKMKGVEGAATMHVDALLPVLKALPVAGAKPAEQQQSHMAMDASSVGKALKMAPGLEGISTSL